MDWVRPATLGYLDGVVTSLALLAFSLGVAPESVLWFGFAGWLAGSISMSVNEFVSVTDQNRSEGTSYSPWTAALSSFAAFSVGALLPLGPVLIDTWIGLVAGLCSVFIAGVVLSRFTKRGKLAGGVRLLAYAGAAVLVTLVIGLSLGVQV